MASQLEGLDIRILSITILLSLVFLSRALIDCMFAFNLINKQKNSFIMLLCIIIFSEVCTSMATVKLMLKGSKSDGSNIAGESDDSIDNHFRRAQKGETLMDEECKRGSNNVSGLLQQKTRSHSGSGGERRYSSKHNLNDSYSSYGSFNPNLESGQNNLTPLKH